MKEYKEDLDFMTKGVASFLANMGMLNPPEQPHELINELDKLTEEVKRRLVDGEI